MPLPNEQADLRGDAEEVKGGGSLIFGLFTVAKTPDPYHLPFTPILPPFPCRRTTQLTSAAVIGGL